MTGNLNLRNKIVRICSGIAIVMVAVVFVILSVVSILHTSRIDQANPYAEIVNYDNDLVIVNLALILGSIFAALFIMRRKVSFDQLNTRLIVAVMAAATAIVSCFWIMTVQSVSSGDPMIMLNTARDAAKDTYPSFHHSYDYYGDFSYYRFYPFQLGYVLYAELLYRIFGTGCSDLLFQFPNVIALVFTYIGLVRITDRLFGRKSLTNLTAIALIFCLQPMFMTTFTYGLLIGISFSVWSVYFVIGYMQENKLSYAAIAVLLMAISVLLKYNNMIMLAAVCIALILHAVDTKKLLAIAVAVVMAVCAVGLQKLVIHSYAERSETKLDTQVSMKLYAYMGITESRMAPGWYNGKAMETLRDAQMDVEKANEIASAGIKTRLEELSASGQLGDYLWKKFVSQFNEPSYESIWVSEVREHNLRAGEELSGFAQSVYDGDLSHVLDSWFNYYVMMVYLFFSAGMIFLMLHKKLNPCTMILPVAVLGGVLYHMLFEAKSQYQLPYFMLMIPFAIFGAAESIRALDRFITKRFGSKKSAAAKSAK